MARIRSIHPGQWHDADFISCTPLARLLAIALRNEADDQGVFEWKLVPLQLACLPIEKVDMEVLLVELETHQIIKKYTSGGRQYGAIRNFGVFQSPRKPHYVYPLPVELRDYVSLNGKKSGNDLAPTHVDDTLDRNETRQVPTSDTLKEPPVPQKSVIARQMDKEMEKEKEREKENKPSVSESLLPRETREPPDHSDINRFCEAMGVTWHNDPSRIDWPSKLGQAKANGLDFERHILPAALTTRAKGKNSIAYALKVAKGIRDEDLAAHQPPPATAQPANGKAQSFEEMYPDFEDTDPVTWRQRFRGAVKIAIENDVPIEKAWFTRKWGPLRQEAVDLYKRETGKSKGAVA